MGNPGESEIPNDTRKPHDTLRCRAKKFIRAALTHRFAPFAAAVLAIVLTLPSLQTGLIVDDYHHKLLMSGSDSPMRLLDSPLDMFRFFDGDVERLSKLRDYGFAPWWTYDNIKGAFWRPLASLTHWLDYILWPDTPAMMHAQSILWYGALAMTVAFLYRRFSATALIAGLAALLFAVDDAHGTPAGFLSNRNALMATFFGVLTIIAHDRWRRDTWRAGMVIGPSLLAAGLLSAEAGISTCAYLAAHAIFVDRASVRKRVSALVPYAAVVVTWRLLWTHLGYGVENLGIYIDPLSNPLQFLAAVKDRAPLLLLGQWSLPLTDLTMMLPPWHVLFLWRAALVLLALMILAFGPLLWRDRISRFWATGMILSVLPICATFPSERLLLFVGIGAMGLVAQLLCVVFTKSQARPKRLWWRIPAISLVVIFILSHLIISPLALLFRAANPMAPKKFTDLLMIDSLDDAVRNQDLVVVNPPVAFLVMTCPLTWEANNQPIPRHMRVLTSSLLEPVKIHRPDANTLVVRPAYGYYAWVLDALFRDKLHPFAVGDRVELTGMTVEIMEMTPDGRPAEAAFRFSVPLEDPSLRWLQYEDRDFTPFTPPDIGESVILKAPTPLWN
ncbi:MAG: hypothetical protein JSU70_03285 [Phycisphaerales bacterium]|nr:MAG: hypothetical protein JSU70_03285 [Phycisphaerales bacterium]